MDGVDVIILTAAEHRDRVWITRLCDKLVSLRPELTIQVVDVDCVQGSQFPVGRPNWRLLINRVADSSDPLCFKTCAALVSICKLWDIPVVNGLGTFTVGTNKVLHHQVLNKAGVRTPRSIVLHSRTADFQAQVVQAADSLIRDGCRWPFLLKPNAGGFGRGIQLFWNLEALQNYCALPPSDSFSDGVVILQEYIPPRENNIFRVWFLGGKVQCALKLTRTPPAAPVGGELSVVSFEGGCAGGECKRQKIRHGPPLVAPPVTAVPLGVERAVVAWLPSEQVSKAVASISATVGNDCHCGSVEFLYDQEGEAVYFDLNMVSTLPLDVPDPEGVWSSDYDPWTELAQFSLDMLDGTPKE